MMIPNATLPRSRTDNGKLSFMSSCDGNNVLTGVGTSYSADLCGWLPRNNISPEVTTSSNGIFNIPQHQNAFIIPPLARNTEIIATPFTEKDKDTCNHDSGLELFLEQICSEPNEVHESDPALHSASSTPEFQSTISPQNFPSAFQAPGSIISENDTISLPLDSTHGSSDELCELLVPEDFSKADHDDACWNFFMEDILGSDSTGALQEQGDLVKNTDCKSQKKNTTSNPVNLLKRTFDAFNEDPDLKCVSCDDTCSSDSETTQDDDLTVDSPPAQKKRKNCSFETRCKELIDFKSTFGHCNVPQKYKDNIALGRWCSSIRKGYGQLKKGRKSNIKLSNERLARLKKIGFRIEGGISDAGFEAKFLELVEFRAKFGHCDVPTRYKKVKENEFDLGKWCTQIKSALRRQDKGERTRYKLTQDRIDRLEKIGFRWKDDSNAITFDKRYSELIEFKAKFGHCNVPKRYEENPTLGRWCGNLRTAYNKKQKGMKSSYKLSDDRIGRLEKVGFNWRVVRSKVCK